VVGTGRYAATTVRALRALGVDDIRVFSPSGRAAAFAAKHGLRADETIDTDVDVVITCASSTVIGAESFTAERARLVIDLALPRNIDPAVGALPGIELLDLETIRLHAPLPELDSHDRAHAIVSEAAAEFVAESVAEPGVVALRTHILGILDAEIDRARARGESEQTIAALRHFASVMLHEPSVRARELASDGRAAEFVAGLRAIYGIHPVSTPSAESEQTA
jgi:glutamyl-tRNA reductase